MLNFHLEGATVERALDLLEDAEDFLGAAKDLFKTRRWSKVCFNSQQSAELALKAALNSLGVERKGHDLCELLDELLSYQFKGLERFRDKVKVLDQYYIPTRYANAFYSGSAMKHYTEAQAMEAITYAEEIFMETKKIVTKRKA
ncbi:TPA: HEPN domain-containing protein [Candidatus Bathyarchaeota archaeon]|nr:HEPN domain-containing protein [Candidatus Bathyarchaeota archaeon]